MSEGKGLISWASTALLSAAAQPCCLVHPIGGLQGAAKPSHSRQPRHHAVRVHLQRLALRPAPSEHCGITWH